MKTLTMVWFAAFILAMTGCGKENSNSNTQAPQALAAWAQADQDTYMNGCITSSHTAQPTYTFAQVQTYCSCTLTAAMKLWSSADFIASNNADGQMLIDNGTVASCKTQAGVK